MDQAVGGNSMTAGSSQRWLGIPALRFVAVDLVLVLVSAADVLFTWAILSRGGEEVNPIARLVLDSWQLGGLVVYKYALIVLAIVLCETVGARREMLGRSVLHIGVALTLVPVVWSTWLLLHS